MLHVLCRGGVLQGMVTQVTDVKPLAAVLTYLDQDSNTEIYQEVSNQLLGGSSAAADCQQHWHRQ
jgi:DNA replicative helicase MCM subunit Mcm2 (Cdc46/Mcm family)